MLSRVIAQKNFQKISKSCIGEHMFVTIMKDMQSRRPQHNEQFDLFNMCACLACVLLRLVTRVIDDNFPTNIDAFELLVAEHILNSPDGEHSTRREAVSHIKT